jgi:hypothetical protein
VSQLNVAGDYAVGPRGRRGMANVRRVGEGACISPQTKPRENPSRSSSSSAAATAYAERRTARDHCGTDPRH